jgi:hypothetical protein
MLNRFNRLVAAITDYTIGTAIVLVHLTLAERRSARLLAATARPR